MRKLIGTTAMAGALLLFLTPRYILPACEYEGFARMHCSDTAQAEMILASVLFVVGVAAFLIQSTAATIGAGAVALALSVVAYLLPDKFGYCMSSRMPCNYGMVPAVRFIAVVVGLIMAVGVVIAARRARKKGKT